MRFLELAATSAAVAATTSRRTKVELLAAALRGLAPDEIVPGAGYLAGELPQRQTGVGWASLRDLPLPATEPTLSVAVVNAAINEIAALAGPGSRARRALLVRELFAAATVEEQRLLVGLFSGELRQGAQTGLLADAVARAGRVEPGAVRRAVLLAGDLKVVAAAALTGGADAVVAFSLRVGRPLAPMLAQSAADVAQALTATGVPAVVDAKLDGIRIQVHRSGDDVAVFTRSLDDITARVPGVVSAVRALPVRTVVLDGEAMMLDTHGRPSPFQETSSRAATRGVRRRAGTTPPASGVVRSAVGGAGQPGAVDGAGEPGAVGGLSGGVGGGGSGTEGALAAESTVDDAGTMLRPYFFDLLYVDGSNLLDEPGSVRWAALAEAVPPGMIVPRTSVETVEQAQRAFTEALAAGQEGVVIKAPGSRYDAGRRGSAWVKVKPRHTLDLVVLAVEWGHGRRRGWLSNLHLGARGPGTGEFVMLGKTFKGLTDEMLRWQTERFLALAVERDDWVVRVRPEQVVEVAFDGVQTSPRYPGGVALRFARVLRYRDDKRAVEADTIDSVRAIHAQSAASERT